MRDGMIFDIKRYAIHDGPGIRTTMFLKGCPLSCPWCQNPEGKSPEPELIWRGWHCLGCRDCIQGCPEGALSLVDDAGDGGLVIDRGRCNACAQCVSLCNSGALEMIGRRLTVDEAVAELERDRAFYDQSGGGVTFSGGEPFMQPGFLSDILKACRQRGLSTTVDTSGYVQQDVLLGMLDDIDLLLWDLKIMEDTRHRRLTGVSNRLILDNLRAVAATGTPTVVRFSLVPGVNDDESSVEALGDFVSSLDRSMKVDILPYHRAGLAKAERLEKSARLAAASASGTASAAGAFSSEPPTPEALRSVAEHLAGLGLAVHIGG